MNDSPIPTIRAVLTPCIGVCTLDSRGVCDGCLRTTDEICDWIEMSDERRLYVMDVVLPEREAQFARAKAMPSEG